MELVVGIVGPRGRMGNALVQLAGDDGLKVLPIVRAGGSGGQPLGELDGNACRVVIDFSHRDTVATHAAWVARHQVAWVLGTTGLEPGDQAAVRAAADRTLVFQASNFSLGVALLTELAERAARVLGVQADVEISEVHHHHKKDAPSGTALVLRDAVVGAGYDRPIDISSTRAGEIPGTHTVGFDGAADTVTLTHTVRDRAVFAHGALDAARWLVGRQGWFGMDDFVGADLQVRAQG